MTRDPAVSLPKWPFLAGDGLLLVVAWWIAMRSPNPFGFWPLLFLVGCVAGGAWMAVAPYLAEFRAAAKLSEAEGLATVVGQINQLERVGGQIAGATAQWQDVQEQARETVSSAREIADRMTAEAQAFAEFMRKANDSERAHLRLEVDKLHRAEGEWLQVLVMMLDHVHALHLAGVRSGRSGLIQQLTGFQRACRDAARRIGLVPVEVAVGAEFDEQAHMLEDSQAVAAPGLRVSETLAPGYTFQGRFLRKALVRMAAVEEPKNQADELFRLESEAASAATRAGTPPEKTSETSA